MNAVSNASGVRHLRKRLVYRARISFALSMTLAAVLNIALGAILEVEEGHC